MKKLRTLIYLLLCAALCLALFPVTAFADSDRGGPEILEDSANEMISYPSPVPAPRMMLAAVPDGGRTLLCDNFISNEANREYINRMIRQYLDHYPELKNASTVVMFFEGGSDNVDDERYQNSTDYRNGAVEVVIRKDGDDHYIADCCENCSTLPDFPHGYAYENGHDGYGAATLLDGIYELWTINHKGAYAALNTRTNGMNSAPCVYMYQDGKSFTLANGTGINVHTRMRNTVGDSVTSPVSGVCLTVGDEADLTGYHEFLDTVLDGKFELQDTTFDGAVTHLYKDIKPEDKGNPQYSTGALMVVDRYLAREHMMEIYKNQDAVDLITEFSVLSQRDENDLLGDAVVYPSHADVKVNSRADVVQLPIDGAETVDMTGKAAEATAVYEVNGEYWYRVKVSGGVGFVKAENVSSVLLRYDDLSRLNVNHPVEKAFGNAFPVTGIFGSHYNKYSQFVGYLKDTAGVSVKKPAIISGSMASYSLDGADGAQAYGDTLDYKLEFSGLDKGQYRYQLDFTVKNHYVKNGELRWKEHTETVVDEPFTVVDIGFYEDTYYWTQGSEDTLVIPSNVNFNRLSGNVSAENLKLPVKIDGVELKRSYANYTFGLSDTDPIAVTLYPIALNKLGIGPHTITLLCQKGTIDATFLVVCAQHEKTELRGAAEATRSSRGYSGDLYCVTCGALLEKGHNIAKKSAAPAEAGTQVVSAPTADNGCVALWGAVSLLSCAAAVVLLRKRRIA